MDKEKTKKIVREAYGKIAQGQEGCGCGSCGPNTAEFAKSIGYSEEELWKDINNPFIIPQYNRLSN